MTIFNRWQDLIQQHGRLKIGGFTHENWGHCDMETIPIKSSSDEHILSGNLAYVYSYGNHHSEWDNSL